jgi:hypothetical protein
LGGHSKEPGSPLAAVPDLLERVDALAAAFHRFGQLTWVLLRVPRGYIPSLSVLMDALDEANDVSSAEWHQARDVFQLPLHADSWELPKRGAA